MIVDVQYPEAIDLAPAFCDSTGRVDPNATALAGVNRSPDLDAVCSVLQYGAIIPPLAPWSGITRLLPGGQNLPGGRRTCVAEQVPVSLGKSDPEESNVICTLIDEVLIKYLSDRPDPVVLFSGGVDSGLIAARLAALGKRDTLLLNYCFGPDDPESALAEAMARHLGLRFERLAQNKDLTDCLLNPGRIYPMPFGDHSTVHTSDLANSVVDQIRDKERVVIDGTGADGAFGLNAKIRRWKQLMIVPRAFRRLGASGYRSLWLSRGRLEKACRILSRSVNMPLLSAFLSQNPLAGILYDESRKEVLNERLMQWVSQWAGDASEAQIITADLALTCAGTFAQKAHAIYQGAGINVLYPFLTKSFFEFALSLAVSPYRNRTEPKGPLKQLLSRQVPSEWVYRRKSGFVDPRGGVFRHPDFVEYLRVAADPDSALAPVVNQAALHEVCGLLQVGADLPDQTRNAVWAMVFTDRWYRTAAASGHGTL